MISLMKQLALIGPTASGKSDLAIKYALKHDAYILSIDSLSIYKEVDIVSAKPSKEELALVKHFGIDELFLDEYFSVEMFLRLYKEVEKRCMQEEKNLVIVGGTSFYLKMLLEGLSPTPAIDAPARERVAKRLEDLGGAYAFLEAIDPKYAAKIAPNDRYRIEKALTIYEASGLSPSIWFRSNPPQSIAKEIALYEIAVERDALRKRIAQRTKKMLQNGLIDEVCFLERKYTREPNPMKAIGIVETLAYLDGKITKEELETQITVHTAQLAKRQQTFNKSQFDTLCSKPLEELEALLL